jgi:hypothetical protein
MPPDPIKPFVGLCEIDGKAYGLTAAGKVFTADKDKWVEVPPKKRSK